MLYRSVCLAIGAAVRVLAEGPLEDGTWVEDTYTAASQQCAGGHISGNDFILPSSADGSTSGDGCSSGHLRAEHRFEDDYTSGCRQFGGTFKIVSGSGSRISLKQTFNGDAGPYFLLGVQDGDLYVVGGETVATNVANIGQEVNINTVHNIETKRFSLYVNGKGVYRDDNPPSGSFYDKVGAYATDSGKGPLTVEWTNVQFWHREDS